MEIQIGTHIIKLKGPPVIEILYTSHAHNDGFRRKRNSGEVTYSLIHKHSLEVELAPGTLPD